MAPWREHLAICLRLVPLSAHREEDWERRTISNLTFPFHTWGAALRHRMIIIYILQRHIASGDSEEVGSKQGLNAVS